MTPAPGVPPSLPPTVPPTPGGRGAPGSHTWTRIGVVARRELTAYVRSPAAYLVATLFLLVQGYSFWLFVSLLSERAAPHAWPLRYFFGGSFLFWLFVMFIASVITMRLVAEERRQGTIEPLLTTSVRAAEVILGKYLGALGFYAALWAPTLVYVVHLHRLAPAGQGLDPGPVLCAYLGTLLVGASALAIGLLASTLTQHQLLAAVLGFLALLMFLLLGGAADTAVPGSLTRTVLERMSLFRQMEDFSRGVVDTRSLFYHLGLVLLALWTAARWIDRPAQDAASRRRALLEVLVLLGVVLLGNVLAVRHYRRLDWTRTRQNTLSPRTSEILAQLPGQVTAHVLMLPTGHPEDVYPLVRDLLQLYQARSPRFHVDFIDPDREADRVRTLAEHFGMSGDELQDGAVVFELQGPKDAGAGATRTRYVPRRDLIETEIDPDGVPHLKAFKGEAAFDGALLGVSEAKRTLVCFTRGHGELQIDSLAVDGMSDLGQALSRANFELRTLPGIEAGVLAECGVTVVAGPERPFTPGELGALEALLGRGGRLLILLGPVVDASLHPAATGLEPLLERWGVKPGEGVVFDPAVEMSTSVLGWAADDGYGDHPITAPLLGRRTVWALARALTPAPGNIPGASPKPSLRVTELLHTSEKGWEEHDLDTVFREPGRLRYDEGSDRRGPVAVALAVEAEAQSPGQPPEQALGPRSNTRLVVLGSKALGRNDHDVYFNRDLLELSVVWLGGARHEVTVAPQAFTQFKLALDADQLGRVFWVSVVALPLLCLFVGAGVWWRRRA